MKIILCQSSTIRGVFFFKKNLRLCNDYVSIGKNSTPFQIYPKNWIIAQELHLGCSVRRASLLSKRASGKQQVLCKQQRRSRKAFHLKLLLQPLMATWWSQYLFQKSRQRPNSWEIPAAQRNVLNTTGGCGGVSSQPCRCRGFFTQSLFFSWWLWDILSDLVGSICVCLLFCILILIPKAACVFLLGGRRTHSNQICSVGIYQTWHLASQCILPQCIGDSGQKRRWRKSSSKENLPSWWWIQNSMVVLCADQQRTNAVFQNNMLQGSFLWQLWSNSNHFQGFPQKQASGMLT